MNIPRRLVPPTIQLEWTKESRSHGRIRCEEGSVCGFVVYLVMAFSGSPSEYNSREVHPKP